MNSDQVLEQLNIYFKEILQSGLCKKGLVFPIDLNMVEDENLKNICSRFEVIFNMITEAYQYADQLSQGKQNLQVSRNNIFGMPLKALNASLAHLTWQVNQVADGDLNQQVYFMGVFSDSFNRMINSLKEKRALEKQIKEKNLELEKSMKEIKMLSGIIPICSSCKKIRDDKGYWNKLEAYIQSHSEVKFSHSCCQECAKKLYPDLVDEDGNIPLDF